MKKLIFILMLLFTLTFGAITANADVQAPEPWAPASVELAE